MDIVKSFIDKNNLEFNKAQLEIIDHFYGPGLVLSTAGSGKTTIICTRIGNLIIKYQVPPSKILTLSYSNASAADIKQRCDNLLLGKIHLLELEKLKFATIHSFAFSIINHYYRTINQNLFLIEGQNVNKKRNLIRKCYEEIISREPTTREINYIIDNISYVKNNIGNINSFNSNIIGFKLIMEKYEEYKRYNNWLDYDDMLHSAYNILRNNKSLRLQYQGKYDFIQVDEAQDISEIQYNIIKLLVNSNRNIMFVGDDDQCIYSYRGSNPLLLKKYITDFPTAKEYFLDKNYRSTKTIVDISSKFIEKNPERFEKNIESSSILEVPIMINKFKNVEEQNNYIVNQIGESYGDQLNDTAILYRDNISVVQLVDKLTNKNIPYYIKRGQLNFFNSWIKNDIIAISLLANDMTYSDAFIHVYNKFNLYLKRQDIIRIVSEQQNNENIFATFKRLRGFTKEQRNALSDFEEHLNYLKKLKSSKIIDYILNDMGYINYLNEMTRKSGYDKSTYARSIELFKYFLKEDTSIKEFWIRVGRLQKSIINSANNENKNAVTLSSFHGSKGLEFKNLFLLELNDGVIPSVSSMNEIGKYSNEKLEEERRLMYVAVTRAKKNLHLCSTSTPSMFLEEIENIVSEINGVTDSVLV